MARSGPAGGRCQSRALGDATLTALHFGKVACVRAFDEPDRATGLGPVLSAWSGVDGPGPVRQCRSDPISDVGRHLE